MVGRFWFGPSLPDVFQNPLIRTHLSFNGQLHFRCPNCSEYTWADAVFGAQLLERKMQFSCSNCRSQNLKPFKFEATEQRVCLNCGHEFTSDTGDDNRCPICRSSEATSRKIVNPEYPRRLFVLYGRDGPFGIDAGKDAEFIAEYVRSLRMSPEFHLNCIYLVGFIESLFEDLYRADPAAADLLNATSALMRTVFRETANPDAGYLAIAAMIRGRDVSPNALERAVYGFNICQNIYSVLARGFGPAIGLRMRTSLKATGVAMARQTLVEFDEINESYLFEVRAKLKWLLGDILKAETPTDGEIDEALTWFDDALSDSSLPQDDADFVRESALTARSKRQALGPEAREGIDADLERVAIANLDSSEGLQRIQSLDELLWRRMREEPSDDRRAFSMRCLGEALLYVATNDPKTMLRHAGTHLSALVSGFALERIASDAPIDAVAGVEAFRSLAILHGQDKTRKDNMKLELKLHLSRMLGGAHDPVSIADRLLSEHREKLAENLDVIFDAEPDLLILWVEIWNGSLVCAKISRSGDQIAMEVDGRRPDMEKLTCAMQLPFFDAPPGRLRASQIQRALVAGWSEMGGWLSDEPITRPSLLVAPSILGSWPLDAAQAIALADESSLRSMSFAPSLRVAAAGRAPKRPRDRWRVLLIPYIGTDLKGTIAEIDGIKSIYGDRATIIPDHQLNRESVIAALAGDYEVVHFCGHGKFDYLEPMTSSIYFGDPRRDDSYITAEDIRSCERVGCSPIVVLSACTSAAVLPNGSNNYLGLAGALITGGASAIIGARWPISDSTGLAFSLAFHQELACGSSAPGATTVAKASLRDAGLDEWSAFMTIQG